jgi:ribosomal protein S18 acetylase RimI-like enzyme
METVIRPLKPTEYALLRDFLYLAIYIPEGVEPPPRSILEQPDLQVYLKDFGSFPHDRALLAVCGGVPAGLVWTRIMDDYGHLDDDTPSLAISVQPQYRGQGIGTSLMQAMLDLLREAGVRQTSLSVQTANPAMRLYRRMGYVTLREHGGEALMVCKL